MAVAEPEPSLEPGRCPFHPLERRAICQENEALVLAADAVALTLHWKFLDDLTDEGFFRRVLSGGGQLLTGGAYRKAAARRPDLDKALREMTKNQAMLEAENCPNPDAAAEPTAKVYSAVLAGLSSEEDQRRVLARLGYLLGRYIYLADALDDLEKDREAGRYNPFLAADGSIGLDELRERGRGSLFLTIGEAERAYRLLRVRRFGPILENILTLGFMSVTEGLSSPAGEKGAEIDG